MRIALFIYKYPLYEQGSYLQEFVDELSKHTQQLTLFACRVPDKPIDLPPNIHACWLPLFNLFLIGDMWFELCVLFAGLSSKKVRSADLLFVESARGAWAAYALGKLLKKPVVVMIEMLNVTQLDWRDRVSFAYQRKTFSLPFSAIVIWSHFFKERVLDSWDLSARRVEVIPGGINIQRYNPDIDGRAIRSQFPNADVLIVFAKPMYEPNRRMAEILVDALPFIRNLRVHLLLGDGLQRPILERRILEKGLKDQTTFMPFVSISEIPRYIAASDLIVLPYLYAATVSRSLLEAMACAKPIIASPMGEVARILRHRETAYLCQAEPKAIAKAIEELWSDPELCQSMARAGRKLVEEKYSVAAIVKENLRLYESIVSKT